MWQILKSYPGVRSTLAHWLYAYQGTRQRIQGNRNLVQIDTLGTLPYLKQVEIEIQGNNNRIWISRGVHLHHLKIQIHGSDNHIHIADRCQIQGGCLWIADDHCRIEIGSETTIVDANIGIADPNAQIKIGADCMLSHGIDIRCGDSHTILDMTTQERINFSQAIEIQDHVWIGMHAKILKDASIGQHSVIAAGSIVTKDIPAHCVAVGVPATVKREKITWLREKWKTRTQSSSEKQTIPIPKQTSSQTPSQDTEIIESTQHRVS